MDNNFPPIPAEALLRVFVIDLTGIPRMKTYHGKDLEKLVEKGSTSAVQYYGYNSPSNSDILIKADLSTLKKCPKFIQSTDSEEYWIIANSFDTNGDRHPHDARSLLKEYQQQLKSKWEDGLLYIGFELEGYLVDYNNHYPHLNENPDTEGHYGHSRYSRQFILDEIVKYADEMGIEIEKSHLEDSQDHFEFALKYKLAEIACDNLTFLKLLCYRVVKKYDLDVTFLPKVKKEKVSSGLHAHISVQNKEKNLFYDEQNKENKFFSKEALSFIQGLIDGTRQMSVITNRAEVSYARLIPGFFAPCVNAIGEFNRTTTFRVPANPKEADLSKSIRVEMRNPDPIMNPYLYCTAVVIFGLNGIETNAIFEGFTEEDFYQYDFKTLMKKGVEILPRNLWEAYQEYSKSKLLKEKLGEHLFNDYGDIIFHEVFEAQKELNEFSIKTHYYD